MLITVDPATFILLYLSLVLSVPLLIWLFQKNGKKVDLHPHKLKKCPLCHNRYSIEKGVKISQCPLCKTFN